MAVPNMSSEQMQLAARELEHALYNHEQWAEMLYATLICGLTPDDRDLYGDAHRRCRFGQWCYGSGGPIFAGHPGFAELENAHERMHRFATRLLVSSANDEPISVQDYDRFVGAMKRVRLELSTLKHELDDALYNLDPLTGTPSRIGMLTKLREQQELVKRKVHACSIAMMDLDHFKVINDTYGHVAGDKVLIGFAHYVVAQLSPYDKVFRYGGEEFLICLPDADLHMGRDIVERLREGLAAIPHEGDGKGTFLVNVSLGLTLLDPDIAVEQSIDRADKALYVAKVTGRNRTVIWEASMGVGAASP